MTATAALDEQIKRYRQMTGEQRLTIALDLHEMSCDIAREGIRRQNPKADASEVERLLRLRLELAPRYDHDWPVPQQRCHEVWPVSHLPAALPAAG